MIAISHPNDYSTDLFCSGHATLADDRLLMMGEGWIAPEPCRDVYVLDPAWKPGDAAQPWTEYAPMAVERWYGTATTMADGRVLATAGTMSSRVLGFGGVQSSGDTYRVLHPIDYSSVTNWGDTPVVPDDNPPSNSRVQNDTWTAAQFPPPRELLALSSNYSGEGVLYAGRSVSPETNTVLDDVWLPADIAAARARPAKQEPPAPVLAFRLHSNTPNPFRRSTHITFDLPTSGATRLEVFDSQGRLIRSISDWSPAGRNSVEWDQRDRSGRLVSAGIYHYRLRWAGREARAKMVVLP